MKNFELRQKQSLDLKHKVILSEQRIREWYKYWGGDVYIAFSGGRDSTVLLDIVRKIYPDIEAVFCDTGLEYPELKDFVKTVDNVTTIRPEMSFINVIKKHGYPVVSKKVARIIRDLQNPTEANAASRNYYLTGVKSNGEKSNNFKLSKKWYKLIDAPFKVSEQCCDIMKKKPFKKYEKKSGKKCIIGVMASDSDQRAASYLQTGCNSFNGRIKQSKPLGFWMHEDIIDYIKEKSLPYSKIYNMGVDSTGCMFCMFGVHLEKEPNRFQCMKYTHPKLWNYCINKCGVGKVLDYIGINYGNTDLFDYIKN